MRRAPVAAAVLALVFAAAGPASATTECPPGVPALARGVSVPGVDGSGSWRTAPAGAIDDLVRRGLGHVRLPLKAEAFMSAFASQAETEAALADTRAALDHYLGLGLAVVLDLHGGTALAGRFSDDRVAAFDSVGEAWLALAPVAEAAPRGRVFAEILNEPPVAEDFWLKMTARLVPVLRKAMPDVPFVLSTGGAQRWDALVAAEPASTDPGVIYAVHYYDPMAFTHQGAAAFMAGPIGRLSGIPFPLTGRDPAVTGLERRLRAAGAGEAADYLAAGRDFVFGADTIRADLDRVGAWSRRTGVPVVIGEFGVLADAAPTADRAAWIGTVARAAEAACLGWTHWELTAGFGLVDPATGALDPTLAEALLPAR